MSGNGAWERAHRAASVADQAPSRVSHDTVPFLQPRESSSQRDAPGAPTPTGSGPWQADRAVVKALSKALSSEALPSGVRASWDRALEQAASMPTLNYDLVTRPSARNMHNFRRAVMV